MTDRTQMIFGRNLEMRKNTDGLIRNFKSNFKSMADKRSRNLKHVKHKANQIFFFKDNKIFAVVVIVTKNTREFQFFLQNF